MASDEIPPIDRPLSPEDQRILDEFNNLIREDASSALPYLPRQLFSYFCNIYQAFYMSLSSLDRICYTILAKEKYIQVCLPNDVEILCYLRKMTGWDGYVIVVPKLKNGRINPFYEFTRRDLYRYGFKIIQPASDDDTSTDKGLLLHDLGLNNQGFPDPLQVAGFDATLFNLGRLTLSHTLKSESSNVPDVSQDPGLVGPSVTDGTG